MYILRFIDLALLAVSVLWKPSAPTARWMKCATLCAPCSERIMNRVFCNKLPMALRDAGMEVIYTGLRQTPEMIVSVALREDVQVIGLSILSGAHNAIVPRLMSLLRENEMTDVLVILGGIIPDEDAEQLKLQGVAAVFQPGASLDGIVNFIREHAGSPSGQATV